MNIFKEIFGRIWALWGLVLFVVTMLIVFPFYLPCFMLAKKPAAAWHRNVCAVWMRVYLFFIGCSFKVRNAELFEAGKNYVVVCNHNSLMDVPITTPFMPRPNKTIAKKSFSYIPFFGWIYSLGSVLVDRKNERQRRESYEKMKAVLHIGLDMLIYPEGTRNRTGEPLKSFYDGAFKLSVDTGRPVMPALIFNTGKVLPVNKPFFLWPAKMEMHFLPPVTAQGMPARELKDKIFKYMWDYYKDNQLKLL